MSGERDNREAGAGAGCAVRLGNVWPEALPVPGLAASETPPAQEKWRSTKQAWYARSAGGPDEVPDVRHIVDWEYYK